MHMSDRYTPTGGRNIRVEDTAVTQDERCYV